jgi:hypothetical protein
MSTEKYRAAVPPENVAVTVGKREGAHIQVIRGASGVDGTHPASVDELKFILEAYPQVVGYAEAFDAAARLHELEATRAGAETALELVRSERRKADKSAADAAAALQERDEALSHREREIAARERAADARVKAADAKHAALQERIRAAFPQLGALLELAGGADTDEA